MPDSPLQAFLQQSRGTAAFTVRTPPLRPLPDVGPLLAGAAEVDITPPPGMPKAGYSKNAQDGRGFRTRLRARVLHLRAGTSSVAIVQCDLLTGSSVVQHLVARAVADTTDVPLDGVLIGATHTHGGPGQFFGTPFYNRFAANRAGFDPWYTQLLVDRIAGAVEQAVATRVPAVLAVGTVPVTGYTRNRSIDPYVRNETVTDKRTGGDRPYRAVNPDLHLVRVDGRAEHGGHEPLAAMVVYSIHGTAVSWRAPDYNADLWGYLTDELAHRIERATGVRPVVGALQGTHADNTPALPPDGAGHAAAARIGRGLAAEASALYDRLEDELRPDVAIGTGLREVDLDRDPVAARAGLARRPAVGSALIAGAIENQTPVIRHLPPFRPGAPKRWGIDGPHGVKWVIGSRWFQPLVLPKAGFPRVVPVHVVRLGATVLVGLPFELTTESGRRIAEAVRVATGADRTILSSVADDYVGYAATAEEYQLQYYEGGHTLYGPATQAVLAEHAAEVAGTVARDGRLLEVAGERRWSLPIRRYAPGPPPAGRQPGERRWSGEARFVDATARHGRRWELEWLDAGPTALHWHEPLASIEAADGDDEWTSLVVDGRSVDDQAGALEVRWLGPDDGGAHRYAVHWHDPDHRAGRRYRVRLHANAARATSTSPLFG